MRRDRSPHSAEHHREILLLAASTTAGVIAMILVGIGFLTLRR